ncbi:MAG: radical SAM protein [Candidatus Omnitrophica bacterium]|nr:radical SAM protein [Candidatus Omnitrophota bacterium]
MSIPILDKCGNAVNTEVESVLMPRVKKPVLNYLPKIIQLFITDICNLQCLFCISRQQDFASGKPMVKKEIEPWILDKIGNEVLQQVDLYLTGGGEPLLSKTFWDFIDGRRASKAIFFNTNGILLNPDNSERLLSYPGSRLNLGVSLNAATPSTYKRLMGVDAFDNVLANLIQLKDLAKKRGRSIDVHLTMVAMKENLHEMLLLPEIAKKTGSGCVTIHIAEFTSEYKLDWFFVKEQSLRHNPELLEQFEKNIKEVEKRCAEMGIITYSRDSSDELWRGICNDMFDFLGVQSDGETFSCCKGCFVTTGNIKDYDSFWDLWNNEKRQKMRSRLIVGEFPEECQKPICPYWRLFSKEGTAPKSEFRAEFSDLVIDIESSDKPLQVIQGIGFKIKGKVRNTGSNTWSNKGLREHNFFKIGSRIFSYENLSLERNQSRIELVRDCLPGESLDFEFFINGLDVGTYLLKVDMVKENSFWFEDKGSEPVMLKFQVVRNPYSAQIVEAIFPRKINHESIAVIKLKVKNTGTAVWLPSWRSNIKVGGILSKTENKEGLQPIRQFRATLQREVGVGEIVHIDLLLDLRGINPCIYQFTVDIVMEHSFWFRDVGGKAAVYQLEIV